MPQSRRAADAYYLSTCAACGGLLGARGETVDGECRGRDVRFCAQACRQDFESSLDTSFERLDRRMIADQLPHYPTDASVVTGTSLGAAPVNFICGNRLFRVRDEREKSAVLADPTKFFGVLDREVVRVQGPIYGMPNKCPVQGDILASDVPIDIVVANRMVRVCCVRCVRVVEARPSQYLAMVDYANRAAVEKRESDAIDPP